MSKLVIIIAPFVVMFGLTFAIAVSAADETPKVVSATTTKATAAKVSTNRYAVYFLIC